MTPERERDAVFLKRFGWRRSEAHFCPLVLAGKPCRADRGFNCLCQWPRFHSLFDHGAIWRDVNGQFVLTGEPYHVDKDELRDFLREAATLGVHLSVQLSSDSPYNQGQTTLVIVKHI